MKLPPGKPLTIGEADQFVKSRKDRGQFNGIVRMKGTTEGRGYEVELLMAEGEIAAVEITGLSETPIQGDRALAEMERLGGSEGELNIISLWNANLSQIKEENKEAMLQKTVMLEDFRIRIKPSPKPVRPGGGGILDTLGSLFSMGTPGRKTEFKGRFMLESQKTQQDISANQPKTGMTEPKNEADGTDEGRQEPKTEPSKTEKQAAQEGQKAGESKLKEDLIAKIRNRRFGRITEKLLSKMKPEKAKTETLFEEKMVETTIDKLFNLLDKKDKLKINESLARELGVSKERLEEWAVILEEHNLASIKYPAIGEPEITKKKK
jgi:hypothetical protein